MKNNIIKRLFIICLALTVVLPGTTVNANIVLSKSETSKYINAVAQRQLREVKNPSHSSAGGEWTVMGLARAGKITNNYKNIYKKNLKKTLDNTNGELSKNAFTEYSRTVIALTSIGENPYNFYGYDVISPLAEVDNVIKQGMNGLAYALIALECGDYDNVSPRAGYDGKVGNIEKYKNSLVSSALPNGGWALFGKKADVDMTAIAIQALAPFYKESKVKKAIDEGLEIISKKQKDTGGFETMGNENCESSCQVLTAMSSLRISVKDKRFVKKNHTVLDSLMSYYHNGSFRHLKGGMANQMATDQALYALVAYRNTLANDPPLFNMKKVAIKKKARKPASKKNKTKFKKSTVVKSDDQIKKEKETKKSKKKISTNKSEPTSEVKAEETTKQNQKTKEDKASPVWFWIGLAVIMAAGIAFTIYKKVGRKDV
ncbi:MAG: terpene cyclase/mutase family protein [Eubacterium sp.]|nr:terpene cyclase/mutase family protein [Eubacterium sp.]